MLPTYGRDLLLEFVPGSARPFSDPRGLAVMSMEVLAEVKHQLQGPLLEVTDPGPALLRGLLSAAKQEDAAVCITVLEEDGDPTLRARLDTILDAAVAVGFDRPLALCMRVRDLPDLDDGAIDRIADRLYRWIDAGLTSVSLPPLAVGVDRVARFVRAAGPLWENGLGVEVEMPLHHPEAGLFLVELEELGLPLAAVRGVDEYEETCGGFVVSDPLQGAIAEEAPCRVLIDGFLIKAAMGVLGERELMSVLERADGDVGRAFSAGRRLLAETGRDDVLEAKAYATSVTAIRSLSASHVATDILDALAREMFAPAAP